MTGEIPRALGVIADFCEAMAIDQVRLVQCDSALTSDRFLSPAEVAKYETGARTPTLPTRRFHRRLFTPGPFRRERPRWCA